MIGAGAASPWALAAQVLRLDEPFYKVVLPEMHHAAFARLAELGAFVPHPQGESLRVLCPYCLMKHGVVAQKPQGLLCLCPDCGAIPIAPVDLHPWVFNIDWLVRQLREALRLPVDTPSVPITAGVWRIGFASEAPVLLARKTQTVLMRLSLLQRLRTQTPGGLPWLITPKPLREVDSDPFAGIARWLPLEECFALEGGQIECVCALGGTEERPRQDESSRPVYGPFSQDFRRVWLDDWPRGPIELTDAQAAIFQALWSFKGVPRKAEAVMDKAGLASQKPADLFKIKAVNKGDPRYEGPLRAYRALVTVHKRAGTYAMGCGACSR